MKVELLCKNYRGISGLARYVHALQDGLAALGHSVHCVEPTLPKRIAPLCTFGRNFNLDIAAFLQTYPITAQWQPNTDIYHLTTQEMGLLLLRPQQARTLVTVHDILPFTLRQQPHLSELRDPVSQLVYRLAMRGLQKATHLIADSNYTKRCLETALHIAPKRISVVPLAIDHTLFRPQPVPATFWQRFNLPQNKHLILYVGSDAPRKNLPRLLAAFQQVRETFEDALLVKVGAATSAERHITFMADVERQQLTEHVRVFSDVGAAELVWFYNAASVFTFPSLYEGFGLPPLEALACGTPAVCANTTSLPEVVGDAALLCDPHHSAELADAICRILASPTLAQHLCQRGIDQASQFTWQRTAQQTYRVYQQLLA